MRRILLILPILIPLVCGAQFDSGGSGVNDAQIDISNPGTAGQDFPWVSADSLDAEEITADILTVSGKANVGQLVFNDRTLQGLVSFVFDDGYATDYTVMGPVFASKGVPGVSAIVTDWVGTEGFMTSAQLVSLEDAGWEMGSHSKTHANLSALNEAQLITELGDSKTALEGYGLTVNCMTYPFNGISRLAKVVVRRYYDCARIGNSKVNGDVLDTYALSSYGSETFVNLSSYSSKMNTAKANNQWVIFYMHESTSTQATLLGEAIDYAQAEGIPIVTLSEGIDLIGNLIDVGDLGASERGLSATFDRVNFIDDNIAIGNESRANDLGSLNTCVGNRALLDNQGDYVTAMGIQTAWNNYGDYCAAIGYYALAKNRGDRCVGIGANSLYNSTGDSTVGLGYNSLYYNTGDGAVAVGFGSLYYNAGLYSNGVGYNSLFRNTGDYAVGLGHQALEYNHGSNNVGVGANVLRYNESDNNTSIGGDAFNTFTDSTAGAVTFTDASVILASDRIFISAHGLGAVDDIRPLRVSTTGTLPTPLVADSIYRFEITHADTIQCLVNLTVASGGGTHTVTPQARYTNSTGIGYDAEPDASNQIMFGNEDVAEIKTAASLLITDSLSHYCKSTSIADDGSIVLATGVAGWGEAMAGDGRQWAHFRFTSEGVVTIISETDSIANTDTDDNLCIYDAGSGIAIKNRLNAVNKIAININYFTP